MHELTYDMWLRYFCYVFLCTFLVRKRRMRPHPVRKGNGGAWWPGKALGEGGEDSE